MGTKKSLMQRINLDRYFNYWVVLLIDTFVSAAATLISVLGISYLTETVVPSSVLMLTVAVAVVVSLVAFFTMRTYKIIIRYSTLKEVGRFVVACLIKELLLLVYLGLMVRIVPDFGKHAIFYSSIDVALTLVTLVVLRVMMLVAYDALKSRLAANRRVKKVLIYGVGDKSVAMILRLQNSPHYRIMGCLTYGAKLRSYRVGDQQVYYFEDRDDLQQVTNRLSIDGVIFPTSDCAQEEKDRLIRYCESLGVKVLVTPPVDEVVDGKIMRQLIREVKIEDLLGRAEININMAEIVAALRGKTVLVTGAAGSIGSELCRQIATFDVQRLILFDSAETPMHNIRLELEARFPDLEFVPVVGDVRVRERVEMVYRVYRPAVVFHAAAYKHVPLMEENPCEAVLANVVGTRNVADLAVKYDAQKMVMVSTDKAVNPTNIMGASKRLAEIYIQSLGLAIAKGEVKGSTRFVTTRFGNVLGSNGSVIPRFREQIEKGGPVTVTHPEIIRYFMTIPEACRLVMEAATLGNGNEIFVFEMGEPVKIADLARRMIELAGLKVGEDIEIEYTGLRPGEKLYEEVLSTKENTLPTTNKKIHVAKVRQYDYNAVAEQITALGGFAAEVDIPATVRLMKRIVPEYKSQNSRFEQYDREIEIDEQQERTA
ncbi:MAG: polysaccharide biosynthesis protein [Rikenellaceae bacterium]|nr:polysaccharide biosynthesis protein [Rikenellaceae bacterium]